jgi:hypothetical protein
VNFRPAPVEKSTLTERRGWVSVLAVAMKPIRLFPSILLLSVLACVGGRAAEVAAAAVSTDDKGYLKLGFEQLASYTFVPPAFDPAANPSAKPPTGEEQIPAAVKGWNGKKAVVTGFMVPVKMEKGLVTEFLLMRNTMACCFGAVPNMNEWVIVKMKKGGVQPMMDVPVAFYGDIKIGAMFENGYMTGLYELAGERMGDVQG